MAWYQGEAAFFGSGVMDQQNGTGDVFVLHQRKKHPAELDRIPKLDQCAFEFILDDDLSCL